MPEAARRQADRSRLGQDALERAKFLLDLRAYLPPQEQQDLPAEVLAHATQGLGWVIAGHASPSGLVKLMLWLSAPQLDTLMARMLAAYHA